MISNKRLGSAFENEACKILSKHGFWVHFIVPDTRGAQPFDIVAARYGKAYAIECKTLTTSKRFFHIDRLEDNQRLAFSRWIACGNGEPIILVKQGRCIISFKYIELLNLEGRVRLEEKKNVEPYIYNGLYIYGCFAEILRDCARETL